MNNKKRTSNSLYKRTCIPNSRKIHGALEIPLPAKRLQRRIYLCTNFRKLNPAKELGGIGKHGTNGRSVLIWSPRKRGRAATITKRPRLLAPCLRIQPLLRVCAEKALTGRAARLLYLGRESRLMKYCFKTLFTLSCHNSSIIEKKKKERHSVIFLLSPRNHSAGTSMRRHFNVFVFGPLWLSKSYSDLPSSAFGCFAIQCGPCILCRRNQARGDTVEIHAVVTRNGVRVK